MAVGDRGAQTRQTILDAAIVRFGRDGFRSSSVADIARDADVSGSLAYAYFDNKEDLFLAALDEDAAGIINTAVTHLLGLPHDSGWTRLVLPALIRALDEHPLAKRVLAGLEPHATSRLLSIPAMTDLSKAIASRVRTDQENGTIRSSIEPDLFAQGLLSIWTALLVLTVQFGTEASDDIARGVEAVLAAARVDPSKRS